jgi:hypothetical protein
MNKFILSKPWHQVFLAPEGDATGSDAGSLKPVYDDKGKDFLKQFSSSRSEVPDSQRTDEPPPAAEDAKPPEGEAEEKKPLIQPKKPGSNVPRLVEEKRAAEKERDELRARTEKFEKEEKPVLEKKVADLEAQIAGGGHTKAERQALQDKLDTAEKRLADREKALVNENDTLRAELIRHDIRYDPKFKEDYEAPMENKLRQSFDLLQGDEQKKALLNKAFIANNAALLAMRPEDRLAHEKERSAILSQVYESLDEFQRDDFRSTVNEYIALTKKFSHAVGNAPETMKQIEKERGEQSTRAKIQIFKQWTDYNATVATEFDKEAEMDKELAEVVKELKLTPEDEIKEATARVDKIINGRATMEESVEMLQKGRLYPALKAKAAAQDHLIKGLRATIQKLRGAKPSGGDQQQRQDAGGKKTKEDFYGKFKAGRRGAADE